MTNPADMSYDELDILVNFILGVQFTLQPLGNPSDSELIRVINLNKVQSKLINKSVLKWIISDLPKSKQKLVDLVKKNVALREIVQGYLDSLPSESDNFFAGLESAVKKVVKSQNSAAIKDMEPEVPGSDLTKAPLGSFAFAPARGGKVPRESNTEIEQDLYDELIKHVVSNNPMSVEVAKKFRYILSKGWYKSVITEPTGKYIYRGMYLSDDTLSNFGIDVHKKNHNSQIAGGEDDIKLTYTPTNGSSSSWSTNAEVARSFSSSTPGAMNSVVIVARLADNQNMFLSGESGFYKLADADGLAFEKESIALGAVKVCRICWQKQTKADMLLAPEIMHKMKYSLLRSLIKEIALNEIDLEDVGDVCSTAGSTHDMQTCKIGKDKYFLKFSRVDLFDDVDPSLQILVEYLAYRIYALFSGINVPHPELVYDASHERVGLATTPAKGKPALVTGIDPKYLAKMLSQGVYVDIFLGNWDVIGTGAGNVFVDAGTATRIDPGGSLTFRAQGGRKGAAFGPKAKELETMLKPGSGSGDVFRHADMKIAAREFMSVPWSTIASEIDAVKSDVEEQLKSHGMKLLLKQWISDANEVKRNLAKRHKDVTAHAKLIMTSK